jgi:hypothetical protein
LWPITDDQFNVRFGSKADVRTAKPHIPYLIAADTSDLPGADVRLPPELEGYLQLWPHVSGVLLMMPFFAAAGPRSWRAALIGNPHAEKPLPADCWPSETSKTVKIDTGF